ncbi:hypothetical protein ABH920_008672 [Catenulispora sp. EB89]|uniref:protein DA1 n=1 Tax=Catenulispora sp. EB89 TaxID=3156257 RepID=UPI0035124437
MTGQWSGAAGATGTAGATSATSATGTTGTTGTTSATSATGTTAATAASRKASRRERLARGRPAGSSPAGSSEYPKQPALCGTCQAGAVWTQDDVRREVPQVRATLHAMGIRLLTPVRVTLAPDGLGAVSDSGRQRTGLTVTRGAEVLSLRVAAGLTPCRFGATVAHECMHAWLAQRSFPPAPDAVLEGICQLVAYGYLVRHSPDPRACLAAQAMRRDPDPVYGDGFRRVRGLAQRLSAAAVIEHVRRTGQLPPDPNQE